jgi:hypothetical protein
MSVRHAMAECAYSVAIFMANIWGETMKDATSKAASPAKKISGVFAQMLAVTAMLVIASLVFYAR